MEKILIVVLMVLVVAGFAVFSVCLGGILEKLDDILKRLGNK